METLAKSWNWKINEEDFWLNPSEESFYTCYRWKRMGYKKLLDYGCGLGRHSILFAQHQFDVSAFDLSEEGIDHLDEWANRESLEITAQTAEMSSLPYNDDSFDCIFAYHVVSHTTTGGIKTIIREIERVLKRGGELYITLCSKDSPAFHNPDFPKIDENTVKKVGGIEDGIPHFFVKFNDIFKLLGNFEIENIRHTNDCFYGGKEQNSRHFFILARLK